MNALDHLAELLEEPPMLASLSQIGRAVLRRTDHAVLSQVCKRLFRQLAAVPDVGA